jgi:hypothetical protein
MHIKIRGGTARQGDSSLCHTCRHATVVRGRRADEELVECDALAYGKNRLTYPVTFCTAYMDRQHPTIREMEDIAWVLRTDATRKQIGFVRAKELRPRDRYVLDED